MLEELTEFAVVPDYKLREAAYNIFIPNGDEPVARMVAGKYGDLANPHVVYAGPGLESIAGVAFGHGAYHKDGAKIGDIEYRDVRRTSMGEVILFRQNGMAELVGEQIGALGKIRSLPLLGVLDNRDLVGSVAHLRYRFRDESSAGFEMVKSAGIANKFHFSINDPKISRLLVLSCYLLVEQGKNINPKKGFYSFAKTFTPGYWRGPPRRSRG